MKNRFNKGFIVIVSIFLVILFAFVFRSFKYKEKDRDLGEIQAYINRSSIEFRSERGFGNDRFDIYSFSLKEQRPAQLFNFPDKSFREVYKNFKNINDLELGYEDSILKAEIEELEKTKDLKYKYLTISGTKKLYLFSPSMNKGYCLILTI